MIRLANPDDIERLAHLGELMHHESRFARMPYSTAKVRALLAMLIENPDGCLFVAERDGQVVGGFAGMISEHWFSEDQIASDLALFIAPDHRGGMTAARLLKAFTAWASERGAAMIQAGITTGVHVEASTRLYQTLGFVQVGVVFELEEHHVHRTWNSDGRIVRYVGARGIATGTAAEGLCRLPVATGNR